MPEEQRKRISKTLKGRPHSEEHNRNMRAAVLGLKKSVSHREKMSLCMAGRVVDGKLKLGVKGKRGSYHSEKAGDVYYRSPLEKSWFKKLDADPNVVEYEVESVIIPYFWDGINRNYVPDVLIKYIDGSVVLAEIRREQYRSDKRMQAKHPFIKEWCRKHPPAEFKFLGYRGLK